MFAQSLTGTNTEMDSNTYISRNREIAAQLLGQRLMSATRLSSIPPQIPVAEAWGPALLETTDRRRYLVDCEESESNVLLLELAVDDSISRSLSKYEYKADIVTPGSELNALLNESIVSIE